MKKTVLLLMVLLSTFLFSSCGNEQTSNPSMITEDCEVVVGELCIPLYAGWKQATDLFLEEYDSVYGVFSRNEEEGFKEETLLFHEDNESEESRFIMLGVFDSGNLSFEDVEYSAKTEGYKTMKATIDNVPGLIIEHEMDADDETLYSYELIFISSDNYYSAFAVTSPDVLYEFIDNVYFGE